MNPTLKHIEVKILPRTKERGVTYQWFFKDLLILEVIVYDTCFQFVYKTNMCYLSLEMGDVNEIAYEYFKENNIPLKGPKFVGEPHP